jgi:hypothetical protein
MAQNRRTQIEARLSPILRPVDAYIDYIVHLPIEFPVTFDGTDHSSYDRSALARAVYILIFDFSKTIIRWVENFNFQDGYILFVLNNKSGLTDLNLDDLSDSNADHFIEIKMREIFLDQLFDKP